MSGRREPCVRSAAVALAIACALGVARPAAADNVLVAFGAAMSYRANASDPGLGITWVAEAFDDTAWSRGPYGVGYETAPPGASALLPSTVGSGARSVYTRARFHLDDPGSIGRLWLGADYDDGWIAWINGVEVARSSTMPAGTPAWNTAASSHESSNGSVPNYGTLVDITAAALPSLHAGDNVLAVGVWNTSGTSTDLVLVPRLSWECHEPVTRGPYLQLGTPTSIVVRWRTANPASSRVLFGAAPGSLTSSASSPALTTEHEVALTGLTPASRYVYAVGSTSETCSGNDEAHAFTTAPPKGSATPLRIWVTGDTGTADANARAVRDAYRAYTGSTRTDLWLLLGDNAYTEGTDAQYQAALFDTYPDLLRSTVVWPTLGNHDGSSADSATQTGPYYDIFTLPKNGEAGGLASDTEAYYAFDWGNVHFVCLESFETDRSPSGAMVTWAKNDILATTQDWVIAFWHHPPYSKGSHDSDVETELVQMRQNVVPALEAAGVDLVFAGHSHAYERSFLLDGHYGLSSTLTSAMKKDGGDGRIDGQGAYRKPSPGSASHEGTVYVVDGVAGQFSGGSLNHPAMYTSRNELGSVVVDVRGRQLDVVFIEVNGVEQDRFTLAKGDPTPPVADFTAAPAEGTAPVTVQFADRSANTPTMWDWDFQDDGSVDAHGASASHTYAAPGLYAVRLTARNAFGADVAERPGAVCVRSASGTADVDGDGIADGVDRCPCVADPAQADHDGDGAGDLCDPDDDGDGAPDAIDCAPLDPALASAPAEVGATLMPGASRDDLTWQSAGSASAWNAYRGFVAAGAAFAYDQTCLESRSADTTATDPGDPALGGWFYYLVTGWNACGEGPLGASSDGTPRPPGPACP